MCCATGRDEKELYDAAVDVLASTACAQPRRNCLPPDKALHAYDETALMAEIDLLTEWFMPVGPRPRGHARTKIAEHRALWRAALHASARAAPPVFVHRDYHAQNLIWLPARPGLARVGLIDFQDAVAGSQAYDLISLVEDARRDVAPDLAEATTAHYLAGDARRRARRSTNAPIAAEMAVMAAQRNAKIVGIFARLYKRDGKPRYLGYLPRVWGYLERDLEASRAGAT